MTEHQKRVKEFMVGAGQPTPEIPNVIDKKQRIHRSRLLLEEVLEAVDAMGCQIYCFVDGSDGNNPKIQLTISENAVKEDEDINLAHVAKELSDISVVNIGTYISFGIDSEPVLKAVDENNLAKLGPGSTKDEWGKLIKPKNHPKPDIESILEKQRKENS